VRIRALNPGVVADVSVVASAASRTLADAPCRTVISRINVAIDRLVADPTSELALSCFQRPSEFHCSGALASGPDGALHATSGDGVQPHLALDLLSPLGKAVRTAPDGSTPLDHPFIGIPSARGRVYALGEVEAIVAGGDYSWPLDDGGPLTTLARKRSNRLPATQAGLLHVLYAASGRRGTPAWWGDARRDRTLRAPSRSSAARRACAFRKRRSGRSC
jgi:hypothetical protein